MILRMNSITIGFKYLVDNFDPHYFFNLSLNTFSNFSSLGCITILQ